MEDITKRHFRNWIILLFFLLVMMLVLIIMFIVSEEYLWTIPWAIIGAGILIIICFQFRAYFKFNHDKNVLEGTITNVNIGYRSYQIVIRSDDQNYVASYDAMFPHIFSSHIKNKVGRKCFFVVRNKKGKAYIKSIV